MTGTSYDNGTDTFCGESAVLRRHAEHQQNRADAATRGGKNRDG